MYPRHWIIEKAREFQENIYFFFIDYTKAFDCVDHTNCGKFFMGVPDHFTSLLKNLYAGQEATELDMEQWTGSKLGKKSVKAVYCHLVYLTYIQNTSCEMPDWTKHKLELPGEMSITSNMQRRRQWHSTPVLLLGKSHGRRSLVDCSPWGC